MKKLTISILLITILSNASIINPYLYECYKISAFSLKKYGGLINNIIKPNSIAFDSHKNFYIIDRENYLIFKFNINGLLKEKLDLKNQIEGFTDSESVGSILVKNDTLLVTNAVTPNITYLSLTGLYLYSRNCNHLKIKPFSINKFGNNYICMGNYGEVKRNGKKVEMCKAIALLDSNFNQSVILHTYNICFDQAKVYDPTEKGLFFCNSDRKIYVYEKSKNEYKIKCYSNKCGKAGYINKKYHKIKVKKEESEKIAEKGRKAGLKQKVEFMNSIYRMIYDKYDNLWVLAPVSKKEDGVYYDVYNKMDKLLGRYKINISNGFTPYFIDDYVIGVNFNADSLEVYRY